MNIDYFIILILLISVIIQKLSLIKQSIFVQTLTLLIYYLNYFKCITINMYNIFGIIIGYFLAPSLTIITFLLIYNTKLKFFFTVPVDISHFLIAFWEEVIWRYIAVNCILRIFNIYMCYSVSLTVTILVSSLLFVFAHCNIRKKDYYEMFLYSTLITIGWFILPGLNFGLHAGRNCYIMKLQKFDLDDKHNGLH